MLFLVKANFVLQALNVKWLEIGQLNMNSLWKKGRKKVRNKSILWLECCLSPPPQLGPEWRFMLCFVLVWNILKGQCFWFQIPGRKVCLIPWSFYFGITVNIPVIYTTLQVLRFPATSTCILLGALSKLKHKPYPDRCKRTLAKVMYNCKVYKLEIVLWTEGLFVVQSMICRVTNPSEIYTLCWM